MAKRRDPGEDQGSLLTSHMTQIIRSPQYQRDMLEVWDHIAQHNADAADRVVVAVETTIELLSEFPSIGTPCPASGSRTAPDIVGASI